MRTIADIRESLGDQYGLAFINSRWESVLADVRQLLDLVEKEPVEPPESRPADD